MLHSGSFHPGHCPIGCRALRGRETPEDAPLPMAQTGLFFSDFLGDVVVDVVDAC